MPTILDVAEAAGVGVGTVSRVLNNSPAVSDATRSKVRAVISRLEYRPSSLARGLSLGTTNVIGALVPTVTRPSSMERLRGVLDTLRETRYDLALFQIGDEDERHSRILDVIQPDRCAAGLLISLRPSADDSESLASARAPVVSVDGRVEGLAGCFIDNVQGGRLATKHMLDLGHRYIAFVGDTSDDLGFNPGGDRLAGYRSALAEAGVTFRQDYVRTGPHDRDAAHILARELFALDRPPTAIIATSDEQAFGVIAAVRSRGGEVPRDVSVIGFDDLQMAEHLGLTTVRQPLYESGAIGARLLLERLDGEAAALDAIEMPLEVVIRETTSRRDD